MTETRKEYQSTERYFAGELRPDQEKSWRADDGIFVKYEMFEALAAENESLRHFIEDRIMDDKGWQQEYEAFLTDLDRRIDERREDAGLGSV